MPLCERKVKRKISSVFIHGLLFAMVDLCKNLRKFCFQKDITGKSGIDIVILQPLANLAPSHNCAAAALSVALCSIYSINKFLLSIAARFEAKALATRGLAANGGSPISLTTCRHNSIISSFP